MDDEGVIRVRDTGSGGVGRTIKTRDARGEIAIAPDGSWLAWQEQLEPERGSLPSLVVHLVPLNRRRKERTITVKGWGDQLAADPRGGELMVLTENTITRWNLRTDAATDEGFGYVGVNAAHYSADAALLIMEAFNKVELRANEPGLPLVATIFALDNGGWFALTEHGAVDGSANATERLATIVTGPKDHAVLPGAVAWDRLAVPHMMAEPQGYLAYPPGSL